MFKISQLNIILIHQLIKIAFDGSNIRKQTVRSPESEHFSNNLHFMYELNLLKEIGHLIISKIPIYLINYHRIRPCSSITIFQSLLLNCIPVRCSSSFLLRLICIIILSKLTKLFIIVYFGFNSI